MNKHIFLFNLYENENAKGKWKKKTEKIFRLVCSSIFFDIISKQYWNICIFCFGFCFCLYLFFQFKLKFYQIFNWTYLPLQMWNAKVISYPYRNWISHSHLFRKPPGKRNSLKWFFNYKSGIISNKFLFLTLLFDFNIKLFRKQLIELHKMKTNKKSEFHL